MKLQALCDEEGNEVDHAAGVAPLVVVPRDHLQEVAVQHLGQQGIDDAAVGIAQHIARNHGILGVGQDALEFAFGRGFQCGVDRFRGGGFVQNGDEIDYRNIRGGDAHRITVQFTFEFGEDEADGLGGAGGGRNHVDRGGAGTAKIFVREVEDLLIVRIAVDRGHRAFLYTEALVDDLHDRREAVGSAGGVGNDVV